MSEEELTTLKSILKTLDKKLVSQSDALEKVKDHLEHALKSFKSNNDSQGILLIVLALEALAELRDDETN